MNKYTLLLDSPASEWELASPVGNGFSGAMIYGGVGTERLQLSEEAIWASAKTDTVCPEFRGTIEKVRALLLEGKAAEADEFAKTELASAFHRIGSQETAGDLVITFDGGDECDNYRRELDLLHGISTVAYEQGGEVYLRETFASYPDRVIAARHTGRHSARIEYARENVTYRNGGGCPAIGSREGIESITVEDGVMTVRGRTACGLHTFCVKIAVSTDGALCADGEALVITNATCTEYRIAIGVGKEPVLPEADFDTLRERHAADFAALMARSDIELGQHDEALEALSVDRRIERLKADETASDPGLYALYFRFGKYLLVGSSRPGSLPANLQGVWNNYIKAPWNNDYHTNINLQMNYWHAESVNLSECAGPLFDYMNDYLLEGGRAIARGYYGCGGTVLHHLSDIYGFAAPADGLWGLWPLGGAWLCYSMWEHYLYTRDAEYLEKTAYTYIHDCARFFLDYMFEDSEGRLLSGPSTSPENRYFCNGKPAYLCLSPTMDVEIIGGLFRFYVEMEELLGLDRAMADEARAALTKMPPLKIGKHGQLMEWMEDYDEPEPGHRHISHMFALYPDCAISKETPDLFAAAKTTLERRLANGGGHTGWSCAWLIALFARLCDADGVSRTLRKLLTCSTRGSLLDSHPPFQIDGNFGASAALIETVMQSHDGKIVLLPACPAEFASGRFEGLCARGGAEVSASWTDSHVDSVTVCAIHADYTGVLEMNGREYPLSLKKGEAVTLAE